MARTYASRSYTIRTRAARSFAARGYGQADSPPPDPGTQSLVQASDFTHIGSFKPAKGRTFFSTGRAVISSSVGSETVILPAAEDTASGNDVIFEATSGPHAGTTWSMFRDDGQVTGGHQYALFPGALPDLAGVSYVTYRRYDDYYGTGWGGGGLSGRRVGGQFRLTTTTGYDQSGGTDYTGLPFEFLPPPDEDLSFDPNSLPEAEHVQTWTPNVAGDGAYVVYDANGEMILNPDFGGDNAPRSLSWVDDTTLYYSYGGDYVLEARTPSFMKLVLDSPGGTEFTRYGPYRMRDGGDNVIGYKRACGPVVRIPQVWADAHLDAGGEPRYAVTGGGYFSLFGQRGGSGGIAFTVISDPPDATYDYTGPDDGVTNMPPITGEPLLAYDVDGAGTMRRPPGCIVRNFNQRFADGQGCLGAPAARLYAFGGTWEAGDVVRISSGADTWDFTLLTNDIAVTVQQLSEKFNNPSDPEGVNPTTLPDLGSLYAGFSGSTLLLVSKTSGVSFTASVTPLEAGGGAADGQTVDGGTTASGGTLRGTLILPFSDSVIYDDTFNGHKILMTSGAASGDTLTIDDFSGVGFKKDSGAPLCLMGSTWSALPAAGDTFTLYKGVVQAATSNTVTLEATLSNAASNYMKILSGTGTGQDERLLTLVSGTTYTVSPPWATTPAVGDKYRFYSVGFAMTAPVVTEDYMTFVHGDQFGNAVCIDTDTKKGWLFVSTLGYGYQWYERSAHRGQALDQCWFVFDPDQLAEVKAGTAQPDAVVPTWWRPTYMDDDGVEHDGYLGTPSPHPASPAFTETGHTTWAGVRGTHFDPVDKRLYILETPSGGAPHTWRVHVYQLAD